MPLLTTPSLWVPHSVVGLDLKADVFYFHCSSSRCVCGTFHQRRNARRYTNGALPCIRSRMSRFAVVTLKRSTSTYMKTRMTSTYFSHRTFINRDFTRWSSRCLMFISKRTTCVDCWISMSKSKCRLYGCVTFKI